jgi:hypothetical protein
MAQYVSNCRKFSANQCCTMEGGKSFANIINTSLSVKPSCATVLNLGDFRGGEVLLQVVGPLMGMVLCVLRADLGVEGEEGVEFRRWLGIHEPFHCHRHRRLLLSSQQHLDTCTHKYNHMWPIYIKACSSPRGTE